VPLLRSELRNERAVRRDRDDSLEEDAFLARRPSEGDGDSGYALEADQQSPGVMGKGQDPVAPGWTRHYMPSGNYIDEEDEKPVPALEAPDPRAGDSPVDADQLSQLLQKPGEGATGRRGLAKAGAQVTRVGAALRSNLANGGLLRTAGVQVGLELSKPFGMPVQAVDALRGMGVVATVAGRGMVKRSGEKTAEVAQAERREFTNLAKAGRAFRAMRSGDDVDPSAMPSDRASRVATHGLKARGLATDVGEERAGLPAVRRRNRFANFFDFRRLAQTARGWWRDAAALPRAYGTILAPIGRLLKKVWRSGRRRERAHEVTNPILNPTWASGSQSRSIENLTAQLAPRPRREDFTGMNDDDEMFNVAEENWKRQQPASSTLPAETHGNDVAEGSGKAPSDLFDVGDDQPESVHDNSRLGERASSLDVRQSSTAESDNGTVIERVDDALDDARAGMSRDYRYAQHELGAGQSGKRIAGAIGRELVGLDPYNPITGTSGSSIAKHWISARPARRDPTRPDLTTDQWKEAFESNPDATREHRRRQEAHAMQNSPALQSYMKQWNRQRAAQGKQLLGPKTSPAALDEYRSNLTNPDAYQAADEPIETEPKPPPLQGFGLRNAVLAHRAALRLGTQVGFQGHRPEFEYTMAESAQAENMQAVREAEPRMRDGESLAPALKEDKTWENFGESQARWTRQNAKAVRFVRKGADRPPAGAAPVEQSESQRRWGKFAQIGAAVPRGIDSFGQVLANEDTGLDDLDQGNHAKAALKATASSIRNAAVTTAAVGLAGGSAPMLYGTYPLADGTFRAAGGLLSGVGRTLGQLSGVERAASRQDRIDRYNMHWFGAKNASSRPPPQQVQDEA